MVFLPGESIPIDFQIKNVGDVTVKKIRVYLQQTVLLPADCSEVQWDTEIEGGLEIILRDNQRSAVVTHFNQYELVVPSTQSLTSDRSATPKISYNLVFKIYTAGFNTSANVKVPICIAGTYIEFLKPPPSYEQVEESDLPSYESLFY